MLKIVSWCQKWCWKFIYRFSRVIISIFIGNKFDYTCIYSSGSWLYFCFIFFNQSIIIRNWLSYDRFVNSWIGEPKLVNKSQYSFDFKHLFISFTIHWTITSAFQRFMRYIFIIKFIFVQWNRFHQSMIAHIWNDLCMDEFLKSFWNDRFDFFSTIHSMKLVSSVVDY